MFNMLCAFFAVKTLKNVFSALDKRAEMRYNVRKVRKVGKVMKEVKSDRFIASV